jgi:hypothetical protein
VTGILHLANKTPIDWYSKKQSTVKSAAYKSEFVAARACVEQVQVMDVHNTRNTLRYLGVQEAIASGMLGFYLIPNAINPKRNVITHH